MHTINEVYYFHTLILKQASSKTISMVERGNKDMKTLLIYLEPEVLKQFRIKCAQEGVKMTAIVRELIKKYLRES